MLFCTILQHSTSVMYGIIKAVKKGRKQTYTGTFIYKPGSKYIKHKLAKTTQRPAAVIL